MRKILSLSFNLIAITSSIIGLIACKEIGAVGYFKYFTSVTNLMIIVMGLVSVGYAVEGLLNKRDISLNIFLFVLKLIVATCSLVTFLTVVIYLQPLITDQFMNVTLHYISPLAFIISFVGFDIDRKYSYKTIFFGITLMVIYMAYAIPLSNIKNGWGGAPYPFMSIADMKWLSIPIFILFLVGGLSLCALLWFLNRLVHIIFVGNEVSEEELHEDEKQYSSVTVSEEEKKEVDDVIREGYKGPKIYHISRRKDKKYQVKFANGKKAIKLFSTQGEAIVFAKKLADSQGGSIRIHSLKGKIRKEH